MNVAELTLELLQQKIKEVKQVASEIESINKSISVLDAKGAVNAKTHYRDQKYLYLIHPMKNGKRKRQYVGADQEAVMSALKSIERHEIKTQLQGRLAGLESELSDLHRRVQYSWF